MKKKINIFCYLKMLDLTVEQSLKPIIEIDQVEQIHVFRDMKGPKLDKVEYVVSRFPSRFRFIEIIIKIIWSIILVNKKKPDMIISYYFKPHAAIALIVGKITNIPVNYNVMSGPEEFQLIRLGKWSKDRRSILLENLLISLTNNFDSVTTTGSKTRDYLVSKGISGKKVKVLPTSIDLNRFSPGNQKKNYDLIYVARLDPIKRHDIFVRIVSKLKLDFPNIKAVIVGDGPTRNKLVQQISNLGLQDTVELAGYKTNVDYYYHSSRIFVLCSEREGFPMVVLEAMGCGLPCVVSKVGDIMDLIESGSNGFVVNHFYDEKSFVLSISKLMNSKEIYASVSEDSLITVRQRFSYDSARKVWESILLK